MAGPERFLSSVLPCVMGRGVVARRGIGKGVMCRVHGS